MATGREDRHHGGRTKWTDKMCIDLISCREQASNIYSTDECPRKENGKKVGIMELTKRFWDSMGYSQLSKTSQNLADKYRHLQKTANIPSLLIQAEIRSQHSRQNETTPTADNNIVNTHETEVEREDSTSSIDNYDFVNGLLKLEIATEPWITIYNSVLETFHSIKSQPGNFEIRTENSFVKKKPSVKESKELDQIAVNILLETSSEVKDPAEFLWRHNCIIYSIATEWKKHTRKGKSAPKDKGHMRGENKYVKEMQKLRREISQIVAKIGRIKSNDKLTARQRRNRRWMLNETKRHCAVKDFIQLKESRLNKIRILKQQREREESKNERFRQNCLFDQNESKFYDHLKSILESDESDEPICTPPPKHMRKNETNLTRNEFDKFWRPLWEEPSETNLNADWINRSFQAMQSELKRDNQIHLEFDESTFWNNLRKKRNWSSTGRDKTTNFWIKVCKSLLTSFSLAVKTLMQNKLPFPHWLPGARTVMIPKCKDPRAKDHRPITCLNTSYKLITAVINHNLRKIEASQNMLQLDQRGGKPGSMGCTDNLLVDRMVLEDAQFNLKNLTCTWVDLKKAFDSVSHPWLFRCLECHGVPIVLIDFIKNIVKTWEISIEINTKNGKEKIETIKVNRGILQGDSFCVTLFIMSVNPLAWYIRSTEGYNITCHRNEKITHSLYVDDLKTYHKSRNKAAVMSTTIKSMFTDIGFEWGLQKCAAVEVNRGKLTEGGNLTVSKEESIQIMSKDDHYKFLGTVENSKQLDELITQTLSQEYIRRLSVIWTSNISIPRKIRAMNTFAIPPLQYSFWTCTWTLEKLKQLDRKTREVINKNSGRNKKSSVAMTYLSYDQGGYNLSELEMVYKLSKIKIAHHIATSTDQRIKLVREFQDWKEHRGFTSANKMALRYAYDLGVEIEFNNPSIGTIIHTTGPQPHTYVVKSDKPSSLNIALHPAKKTSYEEKVQEQPWTGKFFLLHQQDNDLAKESQLIYKKWKNIPDIVFSINDNIRQQLVNTRTYQKCKIGQQIDDICRICHSSKESTTHILTSCTPIAQSLYKARHDKMLRPIYYRLLEKYDLLNQQNLLPWYRQPPPLATVENSRAKIFWDVQHLLSTCPEEGANKPDIVVLDKEKDMAYVIEGTICEIGKIEERTLTKQNKYTDLRYGLKRLYSLDTIIQINVVMDFVGGYHSKLVNDFINLFGERRTAVELLMDCQKWVWSQNCEIIKKLYHT